MQYHVPPCYTILMIPRGIPVGSLTLGRRFTAEEVARILSGEPVSSVVASAPRELTREEFYAELLLSAERGESAT